MQWCNKINFDTNLLTLPHFFLFQLLQNLGKADKTTDEIFEEHLLNFNQQQANSTRLQKDIANYIRCIKGITYLYRSPYIPNHNMAGLSELKRRGKGAYNGMAPPPSSPNFCMYRKGTEINIFYYCTHRNLPSQKFLTFRRSWRRVGNGNPLDKWGCQISRFIKLIYFCFAMNENWFLRKNFVN